MRMAELAAEMIGLAQQSEDSMDLRNALTARGFVAMCQGRHAEALERVVHVLEIGRQVLGTDNPHHGYTPATR
jgi:hypothetical protein